MTRFEDRLRARLQNEEFAAGYRSMDAQLSLLKAIDATRERLGISKDEMAKRMNRHRTAVSRTLNARVANPTLDTVTEMLDAIGVTAEIELHQRIKPDEAALVVRLVGPDPLAAVLWQVGPGAPEPTWHVSEPALDQRLPWVAHTHVSQPEGSRSDAEGEARLVHRA
jgi:transcriptional regulator with XRE-family HTH domain